MNRKAFLYLALLPPVLGAFAAAPASSQAQESLRPPERHPSQQIQVQKSETQSKKAALEKQAKKIDSDLQSTQKQLVKIATDVKENEEKLTKLDKRIIENRAEQVTIEARLKKDRHAIGTLVLALERLDRTPPEAVLARPGAPLETAQSAMLLQSILPRVYGRADRLKKDLARLDTVLRELQRDQEDVKTTAAALSLKQREVAELVSRRKGLYAQMRSDILAQEAALREISARASNLQDLVSKVEERQARARIEAEQAKAAAKRAKTEQVSAMAARPRATPVPKAGSAQLPVSGLIRVGYKQTDTIGAESQGLTIEGRASALVVAPMGGVVRYAGHFKNYGEIIIVEHQQDYHSLIAGLARIDTVVGQSVAAGEPVGILSKTSSEGGSPTLYYELRLKGKPVNPARKFAGL
ncbi:MAG: peptidoglycan DD-metalloendopeptidase family protein [Micavibrio sp.]